MTITAQMTDTQKAPDRIWVDASIADVFEWLELWSTKVDHRPDEYLHRHGPTVTALVEALREIEQEPTFLGVESNCQRKARAALKEWEG